MKIGCSAVTRPVLFFGHELREDLSYEVFEADIPGGSVSAKFDREFWHVRYDESVGDGHDGVHHWAAKTDLHVALRTLEEIVCESHANLTATIAGPVKP